MKSKANDYQISGNHYKAEIECWDFIIANNLGYLEGTAIKYLTRWRKKNGVEDLKKAIHFIEKLIEIEEQKNVTVDSRKHGMDLNGLDSVVGRWVATTQAELAKQRNQLNYDQFPWISSVER